uniref:Somatoliberin n=1 Tax=Erpetoichthys calabaricus TaxID=27687 RepID=A0A8C4SMW9_ERPCA
CLRSSFSLRNGTLLIDSHGTSKYLFHLLAERHADAIFTNSYRKVLGQISARKFLQTIMGKRIGSGNTEDSRHLDKQQNGLHTDGRRHYYSTFLGQTSG